MTWSCRAVFINKLIGKMLILTDVEPAPGILDRPWSPYNCLLGKSASKGSRLVEETGYIFEEKEIKKTNIPESWWKGWTPYGKS